jgi:hypothetical protein
LQQQLSPSQRLSPLRLMHAMFWALGVSIAYGLLAYFAVSITEGDKASLRFATAFVATHHSFLSLGLILGTAWIVFRSQSVIPDTIEAAFEKTELDTTDYFFYQDRFRSRIRSLTFSAVYMAVAYVLFTASHFRLTPVADTFMMLAVCTEYALGVYVGRKLAYAAMMLHSLAALVVSKNLFSERKLDVINLYVHIASTLTIIFVYAHVRGYYSGDYIFDSRFGSNVRTFLLLPAFIATPVLVIFNLYTRAVLRKLYSQSIDVEMHRLQAALQARALTVFERMSYLLEVDKLSRDEVRHSLQLTLNDLPIGLAILAMILQPLLGK